LLILSFFIFNSFYKESAASFYPFSTNNAHHLHSSVKQSYGGSTALNGSEMSPMAVFLAALAATASKNNPTPGSIPNFNIGNYQSNSAMASNLMSQSAAAAAAAMGANPYVMLQASDLLTNTAQTNPAALAAAATYKYNSLYNNMQQQQQQQQSTSDLLATIQKQQELQNSYAVSLSKLMSYYVNNNNNNNNGKQTNEYFQRLFAEQINQSQHHGQSEQNFLSMFAKQQQQQHQQPPSQPMSPSHKLNTQSASHNSHKQSHHHNQNHQQQLSRSSSVRYHPYMKASSSLSTVNGLTNSCKIQPQQAPLSHNEIEESPTGALNEAEVEVDAVGDLRAPFSPTLSIQSNKLSHRSSRSDKSNFKSALANMNKKSECLTSINKSNDSSRSASPISTSSSMSPPLLRHRQYSSEVASPTQIEMNTSGVNNQKDLPLCRRLSTGNRSTSSSPMPSSENKYANNEDSKLS
jgi:hypothetical protein